MHIDRKPHVVQLGRDETVQLIPFGEFVFRRICVGPSESPVRRVDFDLRRFERRSRRCHRHLIKKFYFQTFARRRLINFFKILLIKF